MKVAIVHDWLTNYGGAETFVELWLRMYPQADIYTLVYDKKKMKGHFEGSKIYTSKLQKMPGATIGEASYGADFNGFPPLSPRRQQSRRCVVCCRLPCAAGRSRGCGIAVA